MVGRRSVIAGVVLLLAVLCANRPRRRLVDHFEIMDLEWAPSFVSARAQHALYYSWKDGAATFPSIAQSAFTEIARAYEASGATFILELAAGAGGPTLDLVPKLEKHFGKRVPLKLSDLFPHPELWQEIVDKHPHLDVSFINSSVNAVNLPPELKSNGFRLINGAFHHFGPTLAASILGAAVKDCMPFAIVDVNAEPISLIITLFPAVAHVRMLVDKFSWFDLATLPLMFFVTLHDGFVSCLRAYGGTELEEIARSVDPQGSFQWKWQPHGLYGMHPFQTFIGVPLKTCRPAK